MHPHVSDWHRTRMSTASTAPNPSLTPRELLVAWGRILRGYVPMLSIEITRECPLSCPGCYAYGDSHLGGEVTLRELSDFRGTALVNGILELVRKHKPLHVSLVGGEPMMRHRELSEVPASAEQNGRLHTCGYQRRDTRFPRVWMKIPRLARGGIRRWAAASPRHTEKAGYLRSHPE